MGIEPIAYIQTDFSEKFGIPRQSGLADSLQARIVFEPQYRNRDALRGLEEFSHIWLLWEFSANRHQSRWQPTVRPPEATEKLYERHCLVIKIVSSFLLI